MKHASTDLKADILTRIANGAPHGVWTPRDYLDFVERNALDKVLQRLTRAGGLKRVDRGLYDQPSTNCPT